MNYKPISTSSGKKLRHWRKMAKRVNMTRLALGMGRRGPNREMRRHNKGVI